MVDGSKKEESNEKMVRKKISRSTPLFEGSSNTQEVLPLFGEEKYRSERGVYDRLEKQ